jgi:hypothetical protein
MVIENVLEVVLELCRELGHVDLSGGGWEVLWDYLQSDHIVPGEQDRIGKILADECVDFVFEYLESCGS